MAKKLLFDMQDLIWKKHFDPNKIQAIYKITIIIAEKGVPKLVQFFVTNQDGLTKGSHSLKHDICKEVWKKYQTADFKIKEISHNSYYSIDDWSRDRLF
jgi:hypothetical protein